MKLTSAILAALTTLGAACYAQAGCGYATTYSYPTYSYPSYQVVKQVVQEKVIVPVYTPVAVPVYQAFYVPGYVPPADMPAKQMPAQQSAQAGNDLQEVLLAIRGVSNKVDAFDARLRSVEARTGTLLPPQNAGVIPTPPPPAAASRDTRQPTAADGLAVMNKSCVQCHEAKVAVKKGKNVVLMNDRDVAKWNDRTLVQFLKVLGKGTMPPPDSGHPQLTEFETGALFVLADSIKAAP